MAKDKQPKPAKAPKVKTDIDVDLAEGYGLTLTLRDGGDPAAPIETRQYKAVVEQNEHKLKLNGTLAEIDMLLAGIASLAGAEWAKDVPPVVGEVI